ncbi:MAG: Sensor protein [uncultured bacterium]|nr:MAG: Sensor protein [uncultured bacterium]
MIICFSFLAILLPLTFVIVNESTRPLKELLSRLRSKLPPRNGKTNDIDSLDHTFNTMLSELEDAFKTIESLKNHLEKKVEERTEELQRINTNLEKTVVELKAAQMQLIHSEKMAGLGLLATGLAHEINNSLVLIKGSFYPLRKAIEYLQASCRRGSHAGPQDTAETTVAELFQHIDTGVFRITSLLTDLMTFARPGISTRKLIDVNNELEMTLRLLNVVSGKEITFIKEFSPVHPVLCHEGQIAQVFFNILLNAIQAIEKEGCIRISTAALDDCIVIVFTDNGRGIEPELLEKIFDPFFTTKETGSGTGLGLSICYAIINEHGGKIDVTSEIGKGTVFTIKLPQYSAVNGAGTDAAASTD